jgi:hypothetical protein
MRRASGLRRRLAVATTAATRWPAQRMTGSSTSVSWGSSVVEFVARGREMPLRRVLIGEHREDARRRERGARVDRTMRAEGCGERNIFMCSSPSIATSIV